MGEWWRNFMEKQEYLIGDIAAITGLSRDTLRFYERRGILTARKKPNGYRYFTEDDLYRLVRILFSRRLNMGLDTIENLMTETPLDWKHQDVLYRQIGQEMDAIRFHKQALARLLSIKKIYESLRECQNRFCMRSFPACRILNTVDTAADGLKQWFLLSQKYSGLDMVYVYDCYKYQSGFSLQAPVPQNYEESGSAVSPYEAELHYDHSRLVLYEEAIQCIEPEYDFSGCDIISGDLPCIYTVVETASVRPMLATITATRHWGINQGAVASPQIFVTSNFSRIQDDNCFYYQELYIPVISPS